MVSKISAEPWQLSYECGLCQIKLRDFLYRPRIYEGQDWIRDRDTCPHTDLLNRSGRFYRQAEGEYDLSVMFVQ